MHKSSYTAVEQFCLWELTPKARVLDVGSYDYNGTYKPLFDGHEYTGIDQTDGPNVDVVVGEPPWDLPGEYDIVVCGQVLEHAPRPWVLMEEMARQTKVGGRLCIVAPSAGPVHRYPVDCYRYHPDGLRALAEHAGLQVVRCFTPECADPVWKDSVLWAVKP